MYTQCEIHRWLPNRIMVQACAFVYQIFISHLLSSSKQCLLNYKTMYDVHLVVRDVYWFLWHQLEWWHSEFKLGFKSWNHHMTDDHMWLSWTDTLEGKWVGAISFDKSSCKKLLIDIVVNTLKMGCQITETRRLDT